MKNKPFLKICRRAFAFAVLFLLCTRVSAAGKKEEEKQVLNNNWILCITEFDRSSLPEGKRNVPDVFMRTLTNTFKTINYRVRISPEYAYYEDYAWSKARNTAAKTLAAKQEERALLLFQGTPEWKYRKEAQKRDSEIVKLRETFEQKEAEKPLINNEPDFDLTAQNKQGNFPQPPAAGGEYRFCQNQNADAFLSGTVHEFYGRYYLTIRLYTLYTRSFIYENDIIFSAEDIDSAVDEIAGALIAVLAGSKPAAIAIRAEPHETLVLINQSFAGRGEVEPREHPQGKVNVAFSLENYNPQSVDVELKAGEITEIFVSLSPRSYGAIDIFTPGRTEVSVYQGALYIGEAPLTLKLPLSQLDYVSLKAAKGETANAVFFSPEFPDESRSLALKLKLPPPTGQKRVEKARSRAYWAWGFTWITGIFAWGTAGTLATQVRFDQFDQDGNPIKLKDHATWDMISTGFLGLFIGAAVFDAFQMSRYLYTSTRDVTPIVKTGSKQ
jgi:hypothetical protein